MKNFLKFSFLLLSLLLVTFVGYASGNLIIEESDWISNLITFLESINLNALHATAAAIISGVLMLLRLLASKEKRDKIFKKNK